MSLIRINFLIVIMLLFTGITSTQLIDYMFLWLFFLMIADLIFIKLRAINNREQEIKNRQTEELMAKSIFNQFKI